MLALALLLTMVAVAAACWFLGRPWIVPPDRQACPWPRLAWLWPWVGALAASCGWLASWRMRRRFGLRAHRAGQGAPCDAEHWLALRAMSGILPGIGLLAIGLALGLGWAGSLGLAVLAGLAGASLPDAWLERLGRRRRAQMARELPFMLDLMTLCVEAGLGLHAALAQVADHAPRGALRESLAEALAAMRAGMPREQALAQWAQVCAVPGVRSLVLALAQASELGMSLAPILRAQAAQQRSERFLRAEKLALEAPVKMLFPMVLCIFPCTFLVIGFPVAMKFMELL